MPQAKMTVAWAILLSMGNKAKGTNSRCLLKEEAPSVMGCSECGDSVETEGCTAAQLMKHELWC